ncbi:MAG TPA: hypothetical protein VD736_01815 [Nitrososphaera sp.]|nr:hypothetical protein [Nitrososphaera sp.]
MSNLRKVVVKTMTVNRSVDDVFDFFEEVKKNMEVGGAAKSVVKGSDGWWMFDHVVAGRAKIKHVPFRQAGVLVHIFIGGGLEWKVYVRIVPNQGGSTVIWTFVRPDGLIDEQFEDQLNTGFDHEIALWKDALEGRQN